MTKWGSYYWVVLHTHAMCYPTQPNEAEKHMMARFLNDFMALLPCTLCVHDAQSYLTSHPPNLGSRIEFELWVHDFHNHINLKIGKPVISLEEARHRLLLRLRPSRPRQRGYMILMLLMVIIVAFICLKTIV